MFQIKHLVRAYCCLKLMFPVFLLFLLLSCNESLEEINFDKLSECLKKEDKCLIVLSVSTKNIPSSSFKSYTDSLDKFGYDYQIIGQNLAWKGWYTRGSVMLQAMDSLKENFSDDEINNKIIVASSDTGDVLVQRGPSYLLDKFKNKIVDIKKRFPSQLDADNLVIVGGEWWCGGNCEKDVMQWFDRLKIDKSERYFPYAQGGFLIGPAGAMHNFYSYTTKYMQKVSNDDQVAMGNYAIDQPSKIYIDYCQELVATTLANGEYNSTTGLNYDRNKFYELDAQGIALSDEFSKKIGNASKIYPAFIHVPNNTRNDITRAFWAKLVAHLKISAWK